MNGGMLSIRKNTILLQGMRFHARHGVHLEEADTGHWFSVDVQVSLPDGVFTTGDELSGTLDYEAIYGVCQAVMAQRVKLLETLASSILDGIRAIAPDCGQITVTVAKENPPFSGYCQRVAIQITDDSDKL
jgi:dihydroneopterin aldolase